MTAMIDNPCITRSEVTEFVEIGMANFPAEVIEAYADKFKLTHATATAHARELVRYLTMCHLNPEADYGMAGQIDEIWHTFMLDSIPYTKWCEELFGYYMHHIPTRPADKARQLSGEAVNTYATFVDRYGLFFGETVDFSMWPQIHGSSCGGGGGDSGGSSCGSSCGSACGGGGGGGGSTRKKKRRLTNEAGCHLPTDECISCNPLFNNVAV
ncbi:MAG TPA: hypothetical protein VFO38_01375 [Candidatus Saccharimonadales bacterium]|nr:hypothetical protein [Candidatus Saccharimonadales bacterium]